jgi:hypothetical protein
MKSLCLAATILAAWMVALPATAEDPPIPLEKRMTPFDVKAAKAIYRVLPVSRDTANPFGLIPYSMFPVNDLLKVPKIFVLVGSGGVPKKIECDEGTVFVGDIKDMGRIGLSVGVCRGQREEIVKLMKEAPAGWSALLDMVAQLKPIPEEQLKRYGWYLNETVLSDGASQHYVPMIVAGHGYGTLSNVFLVDGKGAWAITADTTQLCQAEPDGLQPAHPLCGAREKTLGEIAQQLRKAFPAQ